MKATKKMIMVPEMEYMTLLNMLKNKDELGYEKAKVDTKISQTLSDPKLNQMVKGKKYDLLLKQQQQLRSDIASEKERPQNVVLDKNQLDALVSGISKYLGVEPAKIIQPSTSRIKAPQKVKKEKVPTPKKEKDKGDEADNEEETDYETPRASPTRDPEPKIKNYIFHPNYYDDMIKIFKKNTSKLGITKNGSILDDKNKVIEGSNYIDMLDYLVGHKKLKPVGTDLFVNRMKDENYYKTALEWAEYHRQRGEGKKLQLYKTTKGLIRKKQTFKPLMWTKL